MSLTHRPRRPDPAVMPSRASRRPEMNVTPLIDVLLVLLVIFMAALPMTQKGTDVDIPAAAGPASPPGATPVVVELSADRAIAVNQQPVGLEGLAPRLREVFATRREKTLFLIGAPTLPYRDVVAVIDAARAAGVDRVGVVTEGMRGRAVTGS